MLFRSEDTISRSISELIRLGVPSFKVFMSYKRRGMMISDEALLTALEAASYEGGLTQVHRSEERRVGKECRSRWSP